MQFISLTSAEDGNKMQINAGRIVALSEVRGGTLVTCEGKILAVVKETVEEIAAKLGGVTIAEV